MSASHLRRMNQTIEKDLYAVLGANPSDSVQQLRHRYQQLALQVNPFSICPICLKTHTTYMHAKAVYPRLFLFCCPHCVPFPSFQSLELTRFFVFVFFGLGNLRLTCVFFKHKKAPNSVMNQCYVYT